MHPLLTALWLLNCALVVVVVVAFPPHPKGESFSPHRQQQHCCRVPHYCEESAVLQRRRMSILDELQVHSLAGDSASTTNHDWNDALLQDLLVRGIALVQIIPKNATEDDTTTTASAVVGSAFASASVALDALAAETDPSALPQRDTGDVCPRIAETADSAHATGYHGAGGSMSARYNAYREGFVFSDGNAFDVNLNHQADTTTEFRSQCLQLRGMLHDVADGVLTMIAAHLELNSTTWFQQELGPFQSHSQWHIKRYVPVVEEGDDDDYNGNDNNNKGNTAPVEWLPTHTDPSLISIVVYKPDSGAGLQYDHDRQWYNVPTTTASSVEDASSSNVVAVVLIGSVLQYMTSNYFSACRHRVMYSTAEDGLRSNRRMAATMFVRPAPQALLSMPPSPRLADRRPRSSMTFEQWNRKTARNYEKSQAAKKSRNTKPRC
jgi:isopenicillin N synthase-like dioxygenase